VDKIAYLTCAHGPGALIYKRDLQHAHHQLPIDPFDYPLLGYNCKDCLYFYMVLPGTWDFILQQWLVNK